MNIRSDEHWIVASVERGPERNPAMHGSLDLATKEARRLAIVSPDDKFVVYHAVRRVEAARVIETDLTDDSIPF